ncbi:MAG: imidazole glycerol phosphate synthase subunit HisH [Desulfobacterales bacterium]
MIAIIDYDAGNLASVKRAVTHIGFDCRVTNDLGRIAAADRIVFPGVGAAGAAMRSLRRLGLDRALKAAYEAGKPILGICLGTQIVLSHSRENNTACLGLLAGEVEAFDRHARLADGDRLKIPHMGWNRIRRLKPHPILAGIGPQDEFYFVHSFYPSPEDPDHLLATTTYGVSFASVIGSGNLVATQFHLEKSGRPGLTMLKNFCTWSPS